LRLRIAHDNNFAQYPGARLRDRQEGDEGFMKTTEQLVRELLDREAIRDLPKRYCHCVWTGDLDGIINLFAEDGCMIMQSSKGPQTTAGRDKLRKTFARVVDELGPRPYIHNHVLQLKDGTHASGTCYVELRDSKNDMRWLGAGYYNDEYVKVGDEWKFKSRDVTLVRMERPVAPAR
jgi:ketosteroid isomerase-like protein